MSGTLYLLPNSLGQFDLNLFSAELPEVVAQLDGLIAESAQNGRSFLNHFRTKKPPYQIPLALLHGKTPLDELDFFLQPVLNGESWGLISDAGLPCMADPGSRLVFRARQRGITIKALNGPSSLTYALMLSGFPSQRFSFHGYLPKEPQARKTMLKNIEKNSRDLKSSHFFIETPYRNQHTYTEIIETLHDETWVCVLFDLTLPTEGVIVRQVKSLRRSPPLQLEKKQAFFGICAIAPIE